MKKQTKMEINLSQTTKKSLTIVVPVYFNAGSVEQLYNSLVNNVVSRNPAIDFRMIFVDDGSKDNSYGVLQNIKENDPERVTLIKFSRNFGQLNAVMAGLKRASSDYVVTMSADIQDPPELINEMLTQVLNNPVDIVIATRKDRDESFYRVYTSRLFYWLMRKLTFDNMPIGGFDYFLMTRRVIDQIMQHPERNSFLQGSVLYTGYPVTFIPYTRSKRVDGKSKWTFSKKIKMLIDGVMSFSYLPIRIMTVVGMIISVFGFIYAISIVFSYFFMRTPFKGWAPIMILILVLSGIQMMMLGIIGEYLWRTLDQVRKRPMYVIDEILD
ncbi:MAG: glycosyltransferase family 2 protein [Candidatus Cloacimonetes bacterium]|nr:glycosyltransferase family 2 protein [Candidatus Cloacimonadota bacterium]